MDSPEARPDQEVLADVIRRGTQRAAAQRRRHRAFGGAAVIATFALVGGVLAARSGDQPAERVDSAASSTTAQSAAEVDPGFELREVVAPDADDKPRRFGSAMPTTSSS